MPNLSQAIKAEIVRISRKEIKFAVTPLRRSNFTLKRTVSELKKRIAILETENKRLMSLNKDKATNVTPEATEKARVTSKGVRKLREKLGLSQDEFARLVGVSTQSVYAMEHKEGRRLRLRSATLSKLLSIREIGKREAMRRLEEMGSNG